MMKKMWMRAEESADSSGRREARQWRGCGVVMSGEVVALSGGCRAATKWLPITERSDFALSCTAAAREQVSDWPHAFAGEQDCNCTPRPDAVHRDGYLAMGCRPFEPQEKNRQQEVCQFSGAADSDPAEPGVPGSSEFKATSCTAPSLSSDRSSRKRGEPSV